MRNYKEEYQRWLDSPALSEKEWNELNTIADDEKEIENRFFAPHVCRYNLFFACLKRYRFPNDRNGCGLQRPSGAHEWIMCPGLSHAFRLFYAFYISI